MSRLSHLVQVQAAGGRVDRARLDATTEAEAYYYEQLNELAMVA